jgi:DNA modification methylase
MTHLHLGDSLQIARTLEAGSVQTIVTSPPYWGLRDYGTARWDGGDAECDHKERNARNDGNRKDVDGFGGSNNQNGHADMGKMQYRDVCGKCGATRVDAQLGLERTPEEYVCHLVELFRELRRVLRDDGTLWLNLGDSYSSDTKGDNRTPEQFAKSSKLNIAKNASAAQSLIPHSYTPRKVESGLKPKDLCGIPWRVAFALQADGWYLRSDIIWHKPNPMPESVTDRPTKAHEYIFLLSKSSKYYYDADAVREKIGEKTRRAITFRNDRYVNNEAFNNSAGFKDKIKAIDGEPSYAGRNRRSVWTITTKPFKGAHFATFPPDLIKPCILAGAPVGGVVMDPFTGSGTTGFVARELGREFVGIELNPEYHAMAESRIASAQPPLLAHT